MKKIDNKKVESFLKQKIQSSIDMLNNDIFRNIEVTRVECSNGKYDAKVYILTKNKFNLVLKELRAANSVIKTNILLDTSWYRCPNFEFKYDDKFDKIQQVEQIFRELEKK